MQSFFRPRAAFTLVELSIVLVIIGLLVGGVLAGQSLIRGSELRSIIEERNRYATAVNGFRDKFKALPGDMRNAYTYWGADCGTDSTDASAGCNGDGSGAINYAADADYGENVKVWEHLSRAGLVEGAYDGTGTLATDAAGAVVFSKTNVPKAKFSHAFWALLGTSADAATTDGTPRAGLYLQLGDVSSYPMELDLSSSLTRAEALNIDTKLDDGHAATGDVRGDSRADCSDGGSGTDYYQLSLGADAKGQCSLWFNLQ